MPLSGVLTAFEYLCKCKDERNNHPDFTPLGGFKEKQPFTPMEKQTYY